MEHLAGKRFANDEDLKDALVTYLNSQADTWYEEGIHKLVPRYDLMSKATMWKGSQRYVPRHIFSFCIIVIKEYLDMAKRSLVYGCPTYNTLTEHTNTLSPIS